MGWTQKAHSHACTGAGETEQVDSAGLSVSLWFLTWALQDGSFWVAGLLTWRLRFQRRVFEREGRAGGRLFLQKAKNSSLSFVEGMPKNLQTCFKTVTGREKLPGPREVSYVERAPRPKPWPVGEEYCLPASSHLLIG